MDMQKLPSIWFGLSGVVYLIGALLCLILAPQKFSVGFGAGGGLVLLNAWASARKVQKADFPNRSGVTASVVGGFYFRLIVMGICLFGLIKYLNVDPVGLVTGLSVVPAGLMVMAALIYIANRRPEEA